MHYNKRTPTDDTVGVSFYFTSPHFYARTIKPRNEKFTEFISVDFLYPFSVELVFCE